MPFWQIYQKSADWLGWPALIVQPSISAHRKWPEIVVSASTNQVWTKITIRIYAHVLCHSESDTSSVKTFSFKLSIFVWPPPPLIFRSSDGSGLMIWRILCRISWVKSWFCKIQGCNTANVYRNLQGLCGGVVCNICRENPVIFTDCRGIAGKICKYYRVFLANIAENPRRVPVNTCKHLQCT